MFPTGLQRMAGPCLICTSSFHSTIRMNFLRLSLSYPPWLHIDCKVESTMTTYLLLTESPGLGLWQRSATQAVFPYLSQQFLPSYFPQSWQSLDASHIGHAHFRSSSGLWVLIGSDSGRSPSGWTLQYSQSWVLAADLLNGWMGQRIVPTQPL